DDQRKAFVRHQLARLAPGALGGRDITLEVLGLPREPLAHGVPFDLLAERRERVALGRMPGTLDELHHAAAVTAAAHAQREPERRRRFSLAGPGVHDEQALLDRPAGDLGVLHGLSLFHLGAMADGGGLVHGLAHALPFTTSGRPATINTTRSARAAMR